MGSGIRPYLSRTPPRKGGPLGLLWNHASRGRRLLGSELSETEIRRRTRRLTIGTPIYGLPQGGMMSGPG